MECGWSAARVRQECVRSASAKHGILAFCGKFRLFMVISGKFWHVVAYFGTYPSLATICLQIKKTIIATIHNLKHMTKTTQNIKVKLAAIAAMRTALNFFVETDLQQEASYETAGKDE
jgi:hypothetical protein